MRFHVLSDELDDADKRLLEGIASRRENTEVAFYSPASLLSKETLDKIDATLKNRKDIARPTYYRLLIADLLPADIQKALYLDGDTLCASSLESLFATDLHGCPIGMCRDQAGMRLSTCNRLGYPPEEGYFNAGVALFDLALWRKEGLTAAMLGYLAENTKRLQNHDQDVLNGVLHGRIFPLDYSYNVIAFCLFVYYWLPEEKNGYRARETQWLPKVEWPGLLAAVESPRIIHFAGGYRARPWYKKSDNPFAGAWRYFCSMSPWKGERLRPLPLKEKARRLALKVLEKMNLLERLAALPFLYPYPPETYKIGQELLDRLKEGDEQGK